MKPAIPVLLSMLLPISGGCTTPRETYQAATVRWADGQACFSVADTPESRKTPPIIAAVTLSKQTPQGWLQLWSWVTPLSPPVTLNPSDCIPYGHPHAQGVKHPGKSTPLMPGERYGVQINAQVPNPQPGGDRMVTRRYSRHFCLQASDTGTPTIILVPRVKGELDWNACTAQSSSTPANE